MTRDKLSAESGSPRIVSSIDPGALPEGPAALVISHPGHELRLFGWLGLVKPSVFILTDGSGRSGASRITSTSGIVASAGANAGGIYGRLTDKEAYAALLNREFSVFTDLANELAESFGRLGVHYVVGDAIEGYNPIHDVCRMVSSSAVALADNGASRSIDDFEFLLTEDPARWLTDSSALILRLDDETFQKKLAAVTGYVELKADVEDLFARYGREAFRFECLRPSTPRAADSRVEAEPPLYESFGEKRVAAGYYNRVIRYREHVRPLAEALQRLGTG
jgi:hypothetical protein